MKSFSIAEIFGAPRRPSPHREKNALKLWDLPEFRNTNYVSRSLVHLVLWHATAEWSHMPLLWVYCVGSPAKENVPMYNLFYWEFWPYCFLFGFLIIDHLWSISYGACWEPAGSVFSMTALLSSIWLFRIVYTSRAKTCRVLTIPTAQSSNHRPFERVVLNFFFFYIPAILKYVNGHVHFHVQVLDTGFCSSCGSTSNATVVHASVLHGTIHNSSFQERPVMFNSI